MHLHSRMYIGIYANDSFQFVFPNGHFDVMATASKAKDVKIFHATVCWPRRG